MTRLINKIALFAMILLLTGNALALIEPHGSEGTFDIATWNVEWFPKQGQSTVDTLAILIKDLDLDMIAFEEISDTLAFDNLLSQLPGWEGFYSPDITGPDSYQKTAVIYRTDQVSLLSWEPIFRNEWYAFPRPPIRATFSVELPTGNFDFYLIVMHLKAYDDEESRARRFAAMEMLKDYLDVIVPVLPDHDWMVLGDYNDEIDDPENQNIFWDFLQDDGDYTLLTEQLAYDPYWASYPSYSSLIDHILITNDCLGEYGDSGVIQTLRIDDDYHSYSYRISDHRPVMARFTDFVTAIDDDNPVLPDNFGVTCYPNPFNARANISFSLDKPSHTKVEIYDCLGRLTTTLVDSYYEAGNYTVGFDATTYSSGVYFLKVETESASTVKKLNLIK